MRVFAVQLQNGMIMPFNITGHCQQLIASVPTQADMSRGPVGEEG